MWGDKQVISEMGKQNEPWIKSLVLNSAGDIFYLLEP